jgi:hypothetical protein
MHSASVGWAHSLADIFESTFLPPPLLRASLTDWATSASRWVDALTSAWANDCQASGGTWRFVSFRPPSKPRSKSTSELIPSPPGGLTAPTPALAI